MARTRMLLVHDERGDAVKLAAWTPERVHRLADRLGVRWDGAESFMECCENWTDKRHLDDMTPEELQRVGRLLSENQEALRSMQAGRGGEIKEASQGRITGELLRRAGFDNAARHVEAAGLNTAITIRNALLHEPEWQPKALKGKHILPEKLVHHMADAISGNPEIAVFETMPGGSAISVPYVIANRAIERRLLNEAPTAGAPVLGHLTKKAALKTQLQPHQQRVVDKITQPDQPGLVVAHGLGSGKTLAAIAAQDALQMPASVVLPAALRANYLKEQKKHIAGPRPETEIVSLEQTARTGAPPANPLMIVDEAHRARTPGTKTSRALKSNEAEKRLLLTGSPFYNHPVDIAPLVNVASGDATLPESKAEFAGRYVLEKQVSPGIIDRVFRGVRPGVVEQLNPKTRGELGGILGKWVDYHPSSREGFPEVTQEDVEVPMTPRQLRVYDSLLGEAPAWVAAKIRRGLPPSKQEAKELNSFMSGVRQVSNSTRAYEGTDAELPPEEPKIDRAFQELKQFLDANPQAKAAVYSNWLESGIAPYRDRLTQAGIPFGEFTGEMDRATRDALVQQYNEGKIRALLLSSAGGEGLDLKGTRLMQVLDPHFNEEKINQVIGRGARYLSHADLPEEERNVRVQRFVSTRPKHGLLERVGLKKPGLAADQYLKRLAADKGRLNSEFTGLLEEVSQKSPAGAEQQKAASALGVGLTKEQRESRRRVDAHFKSDDPSRWDTFLQNVRRKSFATAMQGDLRADEKLQRHADQMNRMLTGKTVGRVKGAGGTYRVVQLRGSDALGCTCGDWRYRRSVADTGSQDCKHIAKWRQEQVMGGKSTGILSDIIEKKGGFGPDEAERQRSAALHEVAGLGVLAAPVAMQLAGHAAEHAHLNGPVGTALQTAGRFAAHPFVEHPVELAGLGILARPSLQELREQPAPVQKTATSILARGARFERRSTDSPDVAHDNARDHLEGDPHFYDRVMRAERVPDRVAHPKQADFEDEHGTGGPANYISTQDRAAWRKRFPDAQCTLARDKDGYYCRTHRARSPSFESVGAIPEKAVRFVSSTS